MEKIIDYQKLYSLQDEVLRLISQLDNTFYLTGGTALHRFYFDARYSDGLDFFTSNNLNFNEDVQEIVQELKRKKYNIVESVKSRDFYRVSIQDFLQLDFVNDRVFRYKKTKLINNFRIDNKINILTNKISAIVSRDEEKDLFDLFCLLYSEQFNWKDILKIANQKAVVEKDIFIYRLQAFPLDWIKKIKNVKITEEEIKILCDDILNDSNNSLYISPSIF